MSLSLATYFDRVILINLDRRPDRLTRTQERLAACSGGWPFAAPVRFAAVDGLTQTLPAGWDAKASAGAYGCLLSHRAVLTQAVADGVKQLLVIEDDCQFAPGFAVRVARFLAAVPADWDMLMLGGLHGQPKMEPNGPAPGLTTLAQPVPVASGIVRTRACWLNHCYAIRGPFMAELAAAFTGGGVFNALTHADWIQSRDPTMQAAHVVYAPEPFLCHQAFSRSDIAPALSRPRRPSPTHPSRAA